MRGRMSDRSDRRRVISTYRLIPKVVPVVALSRRFRFDMRKQDVFWAVCKPGPQSPEKCESTPNCPAVPVALLCSPLHGTVSNGPTTYLGVLEFLFSTSAFFCADVGAAQPGALQSNHAGSVVCFDRFLKAPKYVAGPCQTWRLTSWARLSYTCPL